MDADVLVVRLEGGQPFSVAVQQVDDALRQAAASGIRKALVDVRGLTGFTRPSVAAISEMARRWATTSQGRVKMAMLSRPELNDPERFGVIIARRLAFDVEVFETESAALKWLHG
jgi:hypothetical protein